MLRFRGKKKGPVHPSKGHLFLILSLSSIAHPTQSRFGYRIQSLIRNFSEGQDKPKELNGLFVLGEKESRPSKNANPPSLLPLPFWAVIKLLNFFFQKSATLNAESSKFFF
jgi:hypothetical protein